MKLRIAKKIKKHSTIVIPSKLSFYLNYSFAQINKANDIACRAQTRKVA